MNINFRNEPYLGSQRLVVPNSRNSYLLIFVVASIFVISGKVASATEKLPGDKFIHVAGYTAKAWVLQFKAEPNSHTVEVFLKNTGNNSGVLIRKIYRQYFTSRLQRVGNDPRWKISFKDLSGILKKTHQYSSLLKNKSSTKNELLNLSFLDFQFTSCEGLKGIKKLRCLVHSGEPDADEYQKLASASKKYYELVAEEKKLDQSIIEQQQIIETQQDKLTRLKKLETWGKSQVAK